MTWNYRIVRYQSGHFGLHEVYYADDGQPVGMTERAVGFSSDKEEGPQGIIDGLRMALMDTDKPALDEADVNTGRGIGSLAKTDYDREAGT